MTKTRKIEGLTATVITDKGESVVLEPGASFTLVQPERRPRKTWLESMLNVERDKLVKFRNGEGVLWARDRRACVELFRVLTSLNDDIEIEARNEAGRESQIYSKADLERGFTAAEALQVEIIAALKGYYDIKSYE